MNVMAIKALDSGTLRAAPARPAPATYLVLCCKPGKVARLTCQTVRAAAMAARTYRRWGWSVTVLPERNPTA